MTGKPGLDKILLLANGIGMLLLMLLIGYAHFGIKKPLTDQGLESQKLGEEIIGHSQVSPVSFKKMVVNLPSQYSRLRFLEIELGILPFTEEQKALINDFSYRIKNIVIEHAAKMSANELTSVTGKILFESRLKKEINKQLQTKLVKKIYFTRFIVQ